MYRVTGRAQIRMQKKMLYDKTEEEKEYFLQIIKDKI